jgi:Ca-activated chloride channel family protein
VSFQWPLALAGLLVVPALAVAYAWQERRRRAFAARFANPSLLPNLVDREPGRLRHVPLAIFLVAVAAMVVGVARPHAVVSVQREEATVVLALDTSRSMGAADVKPTRLGAAKQAARAFAEQVPEKYRIGVISFGSRAVVALPATDNRALVGQALDTLRTGEGTALGDAIALGVQMGQRQRTSDGKVPPEAILVISDGAAQGGRTQVPVAIRRAKAAGVPVYTILVGTEAGIVFHTLTGGFREQIRVPPNPATLKQVSQETGGRHFTARDDARLREIYERLGSRLGTTRKSREVTDYFAAGSAALMLSGALLSLAWFRRVV